MKPFALLTVACIAAALTSLVDAQPIRADHPLIGTWKITLPDRACSETYNIRVNGTTLVTSAEEVAESEFQMSDQPSAKGYYKWVDKIVKDNGKKDCSGEVTRVGQTSTHYISLHASGNLFLLCQAEGDDACIGPFVRLKSMSA